MSSESDEPPVSAPWNTDFSSELLWEKKQLERTRHVRELHAELSRPISLGRRLASYAVLVLGGFLVLSGTLVAMFLFNASRILWGIMFLAVSNAMGLTLFRFAEKISHPKGAA